MSNAISGGAADKRDSASVDWTIISNKLHKCVLFERVAKYIVVVASCRMDAFLHQGQGRVYGKMDGAKHRAIKEERLLEVAKLLQAKKKTKTTKVKQIKLSSLWYL